MLKALLKNVKEYKLPSIMTGVYIIFEVMLEVFIPILMAQIINVGLDANINSYPLIIELGAIKWRVFECATRSGFIWSVGGMMCLMALLSLIFGALAGQSAAIAATGFGRNLRQNIYYRVQDFSFANLDNYNTSGLVTRLTTDVNNLQNAYLLVIRTAVRAPIMLVVAILMAFSIDASLALVFIVAVPFLAGAVAIIGRITFPRFQKMLTKYDAINEVTQEDLIGIRVVKAFVRGNHETNRFKKYSKEARDLEFSAVKVLVTGMPVVQFTIYACIIAIVFFGGKRIVRGDILTGDLLAIISYVMQILISLMMIAMILINLVLSKASLTRIYSVLKEKSDINDNDATAENEVADGSIRYDHVCFSYSKDMNNLTLDDINLDIKSGETIGIIGGTGSGKTSLVHLLPRLYDIDQGALYIGGKSVKEYKLKTLRDSVAMVLQKNVLFSGTIKENLRWGDNEATDEEIIDACKAACADDFIASFPDGYDTDLGQGGVNVSGGQKQRLTIARALLKKPKIMILDDSTSAVDTNTDAVIRKNMKERFSQITVLIIAQRITSVMDADRIVVMNNGKIAAVGTHEELLAGNEIYREIYTSQQKGVAE